MGIKGWLKNVVEKSKEDMKVAKEDFKVARKKAKEDREALTEKFKEDTKYIREDMKETVGKMKEETEAFVRDTKTIKEKTKEELKDVKDAWVETGGLFGGSVEELNRVMDEKDEARKAKYEKIREEQAADRADKRETD